MKKWLEKEIDQKAPYNPMLEKAILKSTRNKKNWTYPLAVVAFLFVFGFSAYFLSPEQQGELVGGRPSEQILNEQPLRSPANGMPIGNILGFTLSNGEIIEDSNSIEMLQEIYRATNWMPNVERERTESYEIQMRVFFSTDTENLIHVRNFYYWFHDNMLEIDGDYGLGELTGDKSNQLGNLLTNETMHRIKITDTEELSKLKALFDGALKNDGIANMLQPQYRLKLGDEYYFLWVNDNEPATIMKGEDTHTTYQVFDTAYLTSILNQKIEDETNAEFRTFLDAIEWEEGKLSMAGPFDYTFKMDDVGYKLWYTLESNQITLVPAQVNADQWVTLNAIDSEKLLIFLKKLYDIDVVR